MATCRYGLLHLQLHGHCLHALLRVDEATEECGVSMCQHLPQTVGQLDVLSADAVMTPATTSVRST